jgi:hypothetical protein
VRLANGGARLPKGRMAFAKGLALPSDFNDARPRHSPSRAQGMPGPGSTNAAKRRISSMLASAWDRLGSVSV